MDIGCSRSKWSVEYLRDTLKENLVKIHISQTPKLDFISKNFAYKTMPFDKFIEQCSNEECSDYLYLRSIGEDKRGRDISDITKRFPRIAEDFKFPSFISKLQEKELYFSSVLRVSSKDLNLWTHYDVMDNVLINVKGRKRVTLFSPEDVNCLYVVGDKSKVNDIDAPLDFLEQKFPLFLKAKRFECVLEEGSGLFIPALWFHNVLSLTFAISVNVFWKDEQVCELYDKTDVYGNKDLLPAANAFANVDKALKHVSHLPEEYKRFYTKMMINRIEQKLYW